MQIQMIGVIGAMGLHTRYPPHGRRPARPQMAKFMLILSFAVIGPLSAQPLHETVKAGASKNGEWQAQILQMPDPVPLNRMISPALRLMNRNGAALNARVTMTGLRIYTHNALPTAPQIVPLETPGHYRIDGLRFHIAGPWQLTFTFKSGTNDNSETGNTEIIIPVEVK